MNLVPITPDNTNDVTVLKKKNSNQKEMLQIKQTSRTSISLDTSLFLIQHFTAVLDNTQPLLSKTF